MSAKSPFHAQYPSFCPFRAAFLSGFSLIQLNARPIRVAANLFGAARNREAAAANISGEFFFASTPQNAQKPPQMTYPSRFFTYPTILTAGLVAQIGDLA
ncbi:MAG TPA: hypothetical protein VF627_06730 [Abditibacterium sp.]|jgi:hypothetical protein